MPDYLVPDALVDLARRLPRPLVVALDVDGTLAPLAPHPSLSALLPGVAHDLGRLAADPGVVVAVVSGRPWHDLTQQFDLPESVAVIGSHGLERGGPIAVLDDDERRRAARLAMLAGAAAVTAPGAWVEHKPAGVALHVRQASVEAAEQAVRLFLGRLEGFGPVEVLAGDQVVEVALRHYDKGAAIDWLRAEHRAAAVVFVGDDVTDESAFRALSGVDLGVKVGAGPTRADHRLPDPESVAEFLAGLADSFARS